MSSCGTLVGAPPPPPPPPPPAPMTVSFVNPTQGATVSGVVNVNVSVTSPSSSVTQVVLYKDNKLIGSVTSAPYTFAWDTTKELSGTHSLAAVAWNAARQSASKGIIVTVTGGGSPPLASFVNPKGGDTVSGSVNITVAVSSPVPVTKVDLYKDSKLFGSTTSLPYIFPWDTTKEFNGSHTLAASAYTSFGISTASIIVKVTGGIAQTTQDPTFVIGDRVMVLTGSNQGLNVRGSPSINGSIINIEPNGSLGTVIGGPTLNVDNYNWYQMKWDDGFTGWSGESYLVKQ